MAARIWIDAFFFRADAMTPVGKKLVLIPEKSVPPTSMIPFNLTTMGGFIDYTAVTVNEDVAGGSFQRPFPTCLLTVLQRHF